MIPAGLCIATEKDHYIFAKVGEGDNNSLRRSDLLLLIDSNYYVLNGKYEEYAGKTITVVVLPQYLLEIENGEIVKWHGAFDDKNATTITEPRQVILGANYFVMQVGQKYYRYRADFHSYFVTLEYFMIRCNDGVNIYDYSGAYLGKMEQMRCDNARKIDVTEQYYKILDACDMIRSAFPMENTTRIQNSAAKGLGNIAVAKYRESRK